MTDDRQLRDELEITALLNRYARGVDTKDWELYRSVFTEDAVIDYSSAGIPAGPRDEITEFLHQAFTGIPMSMHYITNVEADVDGDTATVRAMFYNPMQLPGMTELSYCGGYYHHHELVRTPAGWRSRSLRKENVWFVNQPGSQPSADPAHCLDCGAMGEMHTLAVVSVLSSQGTTMTPHSAVAPESIRPGRPAAAAHSRRPRASPQRPTAHRRRRFRGPGCRGRCTTRHAPGPA